DGSLSAFSLLPDVSLIGSVSSFTVVGEWLYAFGGNATDPQTAEPVYVQRAVIRGDGTLSTFSIPDVPASSPLIGGPGVVLGNQMYLFGASQIQRATIYPDGNLSPFVRDNDSALTWAGSYVVQIGAHLYAIHGGSAYVGVEMVERASVIADATP